MSDEGPWSEKLQEVAMPRPTCFFNYQLALMAWVNEFILECGPGDASNPYNGFLAVSSDDFENVTILWGDSREDLKEAKSMVPEVGYFRFLTFDAPGHFTCEWCNLSQAAYENLIGRKLTPGDFDFHDSYQEDEFNPVPQPEIFPTSGAFVT